MITLLKGSAPAAEDELREDVGGYQQLLAALVESDTLAMEPDPILGGPDWQLGEDLLELRLESF
jgi:hypothetical protein